MLRHTPMRTIGCQMVRNSRRARQRQQTRAGDETPVCTGLSEENSPPSRARTEHSPHGCPDSPGTARQNELSGEPDQTTTGRRCVAKLEVADDLNNLPLDPQLVRIDVNGLHGGVRRLEAHLPTLTVEPLQGGYALRVDALAHQ